MSATEPSPDLDEAERFHLGDLLSITTGRVLAPDGVAAFYRVCDYMTGQSHLTHQLPRAAEEVNPYLLEQHPWLADVQVPDDIEDMAGLVAWLSRATVEHGEFHEVRPLPFGAYVGREPIAELREIAPHMQIIGVELLGEA